ncbi:HAD-like protein [Hypoxylon trugodes]|uniref:HAD-like protein n=1 Tax=Hypoxylon trugodes TaxID=326681 RepID=UPI002193EF1F|nr:HAD-like protein [Hypoxylon trugodes]KAI1390230.1 HAD-like protein [Hypoxylon trugodes]
MSQAQAHSSSEVHRKAPIIKAVFFDFMGTCLDWHSGVIKALPDAIAESTRSKLALNWREEFFSEVHARSAQGLPLEDIDVTHRRTLLRILNRDVYERERQYFVGFTSVPSDGSATTVPAIEGAVRAWHNMASWSDVKPALTALKNELGLELFVLANGTTRLQLDLVRSSGLDGTFSMLFSSELLGVYKPAPEAYEKAMRLVGVRPEEAVMVAAHAYDLRAAKKLGLSTVYVYRWTDDGSEDMNVVRNENNVFLGDNGMQGLPSAIRALGQV